MKNYKGITLIALVITIIVLLILAGVTIATLTGDNGLLQKATTAKEQTKSSEAEELIKLIYAEYQISKYAEGNMSAGDYLKEQLEKTYGEGNVDLISSEESIVLKVIENGESKFYEYNPSTGISKELQKGINYNGKTASEIQPGDDITIGSEKFKVFAVENNTIKAMPYYNITLTDTPVQSKNAGLTDFSTSKYWTEENEIIDMTDSRNKIQKYIINYGNTLKKYEIEGINVRIALKNELNESGITNNMRNPLKNARFWLGTADYATIVWYVNTDGIIRFDNGCGYYNNKNNGVRPIIEIPIE